MRLFGRSMAVLGAAVMLASAGPGLVSAQSALDSLDRTGERLGWEAVGRLDLPGGFCTGTLIAPDLVLTAAHCVTTSRGLVSPEDVTFRAGLTDGRAVAERVATRIVVPEEYVPDDTGTLQSSLIPFDVALIRLDRAISSSEADPFVLSAGLPQDAAVSVVSYGRGRADALARQRSCNVTGQYRGGLMEFDCDVTFGSSGAPVFVRYGTRVRIVSLISGGQDLGSGRSISYGMTLPEVVMELKADLGRAPAAAPVSAGARRVQVGQRSVGGARFVRP